MTLMAFLSFSSYCTISRKGKFFKIEVKSKNGRVLPPKGIRDQLEKVVKMAGGETSCFFAPNKIFYSSAHCIPVPQ